MEWYLKVLRQYADFSGRARRKEYWMFTLFHVIFTVSAVMIDGLVFNMGFDSGFGFVYMGYVLATLLPSVAVSVRRLHDVGKSGWFLMISLIPLIGSIWLLVLYVTEGEQTENAWGPDPKSPDHYDMIDEFGADYVEEG
ncbi:MAG: DUF805 domain-containing protein [Bacteroidota bacterium]